MISETVLYGRVDIQALSALDVWESVITDATDVIAKRGGSRNGLGIKTDVGLMAFSISGSDDPMDGGRFIPGLPVRAVRLTETDPEPLFTGTVLDVAARYPLDKATGASRAVTVVTVADAVRQHTTTPRYGVVIADPFNETFEARITRLEGSATVPVDAPTIGDPIVRYAL